MHLFGKKFHPLKVVYKCALHGGQSEPGFDLIALRSPHAHAQEAAIAKHPAPDVTHP